MFGTKHRQELGIPTCPLRIKAPFSVGCSPPHNDSFKLNIDGRSRGNPGQTGYGGVLRDDQGLVILCFRHHLGVGSNTYLEVMELRMGLEYCYLLNTEQVVIEGLFRNIWAEVMIIADYIDVKVCHV
ncbi:ribonuclease h [Olea europaea subsp. europaea]|uniref:Ribonuclease h n=1 Tax=Olea europaea subsp. europaea TaxID=158383 RepID=A0A8S0UDR7_OLEEU|nr:ribonuclease h [Olea europaea subsp. europaea]